MDTSIKNAKDYYAIDIIHLAKTLLHRIWIVILAGILAAAAGFSYASFFITPLYSSNVRIYVNNSSISVGSASLSISSAEISASQSLVKTYIVILKDESTLELIAEKADLPYSAGQLGGMISASAVNETEIMRITVTSSDPYEASKIANCIADVLQIRISEIIKGTSMEVVGYSKPNLHKVSPSITSYTAKGFAVGAVIAAAIIVLVALYDNTIRDEEYLIQADDYPLLAKIPDLFDTGSSKYGYKKYGYYQSNK